MTASMVIALAGCGGSDGGSAPQRSTSSTAPEPPAATPSPACASDASGEATDRIDVEVDGTDRAALLHVPAGSATFDDPLPVVVSFHGANGSGAVQQSTDGLAAIADEEQFVVLYPEGLMVGLNDQVGGISGWDADGSSVDEPAFVAALLDELGSTVCIDTSRVFLTGFSAGGNIALVVGCALGERIAAVAVVSAAFQPDECEGASPMPTLAFQGLTDIVVPAEGRDTATAGTLLPARAVMADQADRNGCAAEPTTSDEEPGVRRLNWDDCDAATELVELDDHGHAWPGHPMPFDRDVLVDLFAGGAGHPANPLMVAIGETPETMADNVLLTSDAVDASALIWEFFADARPK